MLNLNIPDMNSIDIEDKKTIFAMRVEDEYLLMYSKLKLEIVKIEMVNENKNQYKIYTLDIHGLEMDQSIFIKNSNVFNGYHVVKEIINNKCFVIEFVNKHDEYIGNKGLVFNEKFQHKKINTEKEADEEIHHIGNPLCNQLTTPEGRMGMYLNN